MSNFITPTKKKNRRHLTYGMPYNHNTSITPSYWRSQNPILTILPVRESVCALNQTYKKLLEQWKNERFARYKRSQQL